MKKDLGHLRKVYEKGSLEVSSVGTDPLLFFKKWFDQAQSYKIIDEPNAFSLSTISKDGFPKSRIVLLKSFDSEGFIFYTNYNSEKGKDILSNPKVGVSFFWPSLERQIIIKGSASKLNDDISDKYFDARRPPVTLMFGIVEIASLFLIFFGPDSTVVLTIAFLIYGFTLSGLLAVLGGLFAIDIAPKNISGAAMGFIGLFSYIGAGLQEKISSLLIKTSTQNDTSALLYNFDDAIIFWVFASIVSFILSLALWNKKTED